MLRYLQPVLLVSVLLVSGVIHGLWSDRWMPASQMRIAEAAQKVKDFPLHVGSWEGEAAPWAEVEATEKVETTVIRRYVNRRTGDSIGMLLSCGNPRNLTMFHTPLECYPAAGYELIRPSTPYSLSLGQDSASAELLVSDFKMATGPLTQYVRVVWAWSGSGAWEVPDNLRLSFGRYRVLYKVYATRSLNRPDEPIDTDPCLDFLRELLPLINSTLIRGQ